MGSPICTECRHHCFSREDYLCRANPKRRIKSHTTGGLSWPKCDVINQHGHCQLFQAGEPDDSALTRVAAQQHLLKTGDCVIFHGPWETVYATVEEFRYSNNCGYSGWAIQLHNGHGGRFVHIRDLTLVPDGPVIKIT